MKKTILAALVAIHSVVLAHGQTTESNATPIITVTKNAQSDFQIGSAFSRIDAEEINRSQQGTLLDVLNITPGIQAIEAGAPGGFGEVMIRGNGPSQSLILVNGVKVNTGINQDAAPFLSYAGSKGLRKIEIVRGPQSSLYGSESIGGVISLDTQRGEGKPGVDFFGEFGSFTTFNEGVSSQGEIGNFAYFASYENLYTQNDRPNNDCTVNRYALRLDYQALENLSLRFNFTGQVGQYQEPGSVRPQDWGNKNPGQHTRGESNILSLMVDWRPIEFWTQQLTLGTNFERYTLTDPAYPGNFETDSNTINNATNYCTDWMNVFQISRQNRLSLGISFDAYTGDFYSRYGAGPATVLPTESQTDVAFYAQDEWELVKNLFLTGAVRYDSYSQAGSALTYRFTSAYLFEKTNTKFRGSYGTGFKAPNLIQLYSTNPYYIGNKNLKPEKSIGWDAGIDQYFFDHRIKLSATYFQNSIENLVSVESDPVTWFGQYENIDTATNNGVELSAEVSLLNNWNTRIAYTYTQTTLYTQFPQQKNAITIDTNYLFTTKWLIGCGATCVGGRRQEDFTAGTIVDLPTYATLRFYSRYEINKHAAVTARVENATNTAYETRLGYPVLPIGFYGGVEISF
jgi:vitamin B12 transporter